MRVYVKPGGQRGYSGHCINLPQNVKEIAAALPRCPSQLHLCNYERTRKYFSRTFMSGNLRLKLL